MELQLIDPQKEKEIIEALIDQRYYNPFDVFQHEPEFWKSPDPKYLHKIHIVKWNTKSTRITVLYVRHDSEKNKWIFCKKRGQKRTPHGEKMR